MYTYKKKDKQGELKLKISNKDWEEALQNAYEKNKSKYNVQGFRKGKAPRRVIEQTYGDTVFFDEAFEEVVAKEYYDFLAKNKEVRPAGAPDVKMDSFTADKGVEATVTFDLMPEVTLGDLSNLKAKMEKVTVGEKELTAELEKVRSSHARFVETDKAVANGDIATIDFSGSVDGKKFEGGTSENYRLEIGSNTFIEGFEPQIVGMKKGETKDINVVFPKNYHASELKGKPAVFEVTVKKVEQRELPTLNDKFISDITEFETLDEYKKSLKEKLKKEAERRAKFEFENALIEEVVGLCKVDIPHSMIHEEAHYMIHDLEHRLSHQNLTLENYLAYTGQTMESLHDKMEVDAEKTIRTRLVLQEIIKQNKLTASAQDVDNKLKEYAETSGLNLDELKSNVTKEDLAYFENEALMDKIIKFLTKNADKPKK